jgi:beta-lactam-binding protein with PASTA domain
MATTCVLSMTADRSVTAGFAKKANCKVPRVVGLKLGKARAKIARAHCRVGKVTKKASTRRQRGRVLAQSPKAGKTLPAGGTTNLKVGKGPKKK